MRNRIHLGLLGGTMVAALNWSSSGMAADASGRFAVERIGQVTCGSFSVAKTARNPAYDSMLDFAEGYLTAANRYEPNTFDLSPWHTKGGLGIILNGYCHAHGSDHFVAALEKLVTAMRPIRLAEYSPSISFVAGSKQADAYQAILKRAQSVLHRQGRFSGAEDGRDSPQFRDALRAFQVSAKLEPTGLPDSATLWELLNP